MSRSFLLPALVAVAACADRGGVTGDAARDAPLDAAWDLGADVHPCDDPGTVLCTLGSVYPDRAVIDPDDPDYEGDGYTREEVDALFAQARAEDSQVYRAYRAAHTHPELTECAFCACGCADMSIDHRSAVDCFKDMHGFG